MPSLVLQTNVKVPDAKAFVLEFSKLGANTLAMPEMYITASYTYNDTLTFAGTFEPAFVLTINSLGNLTPELNEAYSKTFFDFFKDKLSVPGDRGYITFIDPGKANMGYSGTTFEAMLGAKK